MSVTSNLLEHNQAFIALVDGFDFTLPGKDQSLGRDVVTTVALGINERTQADVKDADGGTLKPNTPKYAAMKARKHDVHQPGVLTGQMLSIESLKGEATIEADQITMAYGTGEQPSRYSTRGQIKGNEPTDREKAAYFTESGRPFYALDDAINDAVRSECREALADYLENA